MSRVASRSSIDRLELNPSAFANKVPTYLHAKQSNRRGEPPAMRPQDMMRFYVSDDVEDDVRQCIRSWEHRHSISVTGRTETGEIKGFSGTVEAVARAPGLATGEFWLVTMRESKPTLDCSMPASEPRQTRLTLILSVQIRFMSIFGTELRRTKDG
jgi:hypothetical protein